MPNCPKNDVIGFFSSITRGTIKRFNVYFKFEDVISFHKSYIFDTEGRTFWMSIRAGPKEIYCRCGMMIWRPLP